MNIRVTLFFSFMVGCTTLFGVFENNTALIIPEASYFIPVKDQNQETSEWPLQYVVFYSAQGDELEKVPYDSRDLSNYIILSKRLDLSACKPQPISYQVSYRAFTSVFHSSSNCRVDFYDKHGHRIKRYSYNYKDRTFGSLAQEGFMKTLDELDEIDISKIRPDLLSDMDDEYSELNREEFDSGVCTIL